MPAKSHRQAAPAPPGGGFAAPAEIEIAVLAADIRNGERRSACRCPVARAAARAIGVAPTEQWVSVGLATLGLSFPENPYEMYHYDLPAIAVEFIPKFDTEPIGNYAPFTFTAKLHQGEITDGRY